MVENQPGFIVGLPNADKPVVVPLAPDTPVTGDVGVVLNGIVFPVYSATTGDAPCMVVSVPKEPTKQYCIALEPPKVLPLQKTNGYFTLLDSPLETDDDFDDSWKSQDGYIKNVTGLTFGCASADEYDDPEAIQYIYSTTTQTPYPAQRTLGGSDRPYMVESSAGSPPDNNVYTGTATAAPAVGTVWDGKPFIPDYTQTYWQTLAVRAYTEGRIVSNVSTVQFRVLPGRLTVDYNAGSKELKVTCPGTVQPRSGKNFYLQNPSGSWLYQNKTLSDAKATLSESGLFKLHWLGMPDYGLPNTWAGYLFWSGNIVIDGDEPTASFTKTIWLPTPTSWQPIEQEISKVAVKLTKDLTADYWISPNGSGNGLTKDAPGSWASVLGTINSDGSAGTTGAIGSPQSAKVVRATTGSYSTGIANQLLKIPSNVTVIGGHDYEFKAVTGKSTVSSEVNSYGTMENFSLHFYCRNNYTGYTSVTINSDYCIKFYRFRNCDIMGSDSEVTAALDSSGTSYNYTAKQLAVYADSFYNCQLRFGGYYLFLQGSLSGCTFEYDGGGVIVLPSKDTYNDWVWNDSTHGYEESNTTVERNICYYPECYLQSSEIINSTVDIQRVCTAQVGHSGGGYRLKNSTVKINCVTQQGGIISSGRLVDAEIVYAKSSETKPDGSYFDTWYEGATAEGHDYHDQPWQAWMSNYCWHSTAAQGLKYCMRGYNVSCGFSVAINSTIEIRIPSTPNGGSGGNGFKKEVTIPAHQEWQYVDTGRVETYTWTDEEGVEHVETYPIWEMQEVTIPSYKYRFWEVGANGQSACDINVTLPKNMRKCKLNLTIDGAGNGGNGGSGSDLPLSEWLQTDGGEHGYDRYLSDARYRPHNRAAGIPGLGGRIFINSPVRWTQDCDFNFAVGQGGLSGTNNFSGAGVRGNVPGNIVHPDGCDYNAWAGNTFDQCQGMWLYHTDLRHTSYGYFYGVYGTQSYFECTNGYYGGRGGQTAAELGIDTTELGSPTIINGGSGGHGIPVVGFGTPGQGGGTAADGIKLGDFWE